MRDVTFLLLLLRSVWLSPSGIQSLSLQRRNLVRASYLRAAADPFWAKGLDFQCTGCGKCCQTEGEVWLDPDEFIDITEQLGITREGFLEGYVDQVVNGWSLLKSKPPVSPAEEAVTVTEQCVFLDKDGKKCTIYDSRPTQCRTYPYWPSLLRSKKTWDDERVLPDGVPLLEGSSEKYWSLEGGGCEGIENREVGVTVSPTTIHRNNHVYRAYLDAFPATRIGDDEERLLEKTDVIERVRRSTVAWVNDFVVAYNLCPFARSLVASPRVKYRVSMKSNIDDIIEKIKYEVYYLLASKADEVETTLIVLPFAFPHFEDFYAFSLEVEDELLPLWELQSKGPRHTKNASRRLIEDNEDNSEIKMAFFHPTFCWSDAEMADPLNYEKRSPFPTINLLRAAQIREYANQNKTRKIADSNQSMLEAAGAARLSEEFNHIIRIALD